MGQHSQTASNTAQSGQKLVQDLATGITNGVGSSVGLSKEAAQGKAFSAVLQASRFWCQCWTGRKRGNGETGGLGGALGLKGAILSRINSDSSLSDAQKKNNV